MSETVLRVVPIERSWSPPIAADDAVRSLVTAALGAGASVEVRRYDGVRFIDAGTNASAARCPVCSLELDGSWWGEAMTRAHEGGFRDLEVVVPCCGATSSLDELDHGWPQAFASWELRVRGVGELSDVLLDRIVSEVGHGVRVVPARY